MTARTAVAVGASLATLVSAGPAYAGFGGTNGKIVFTRATNNGDIYSINSDGTGEMALTSTGDADSAPAYSPGGNKIAFIRAGDVWIMNSDGSSPTQLTSTGAAESAPDWTPAGDRILFARTGDIWVRNADGTGSETQLTTDPGVDGRPEAAIDGSSYIVFFTTDREGNTETYVHVLGFGDAALGAGAQSAQADDDPDPSPSAAALTFSSTRDGGDRDVFTRNLITDVETNRTGATAADDFAPAYSPNAARIVFVSTRDANGDNEIFVMNADGTGVSQLTSNTVSDTDPDWGPVTGTASGRWQTCTFGFAQACVQEFTVSVGGSVPGLGPPPGSLQHYVFGPGSIGVTRTGINDLTQYDLTGAGPLTTASLVHLVLNIGSTDPIAMLATSTVVGYSSALSASTGNTVTLDLRPRSTSWIAPQCPDLNPLELDCGNDLTQASFDGGMVFASVSDLDPGAVPPDVAAEYAAWRAAMRGAWMSTDAQQFAPPSYDPVSNSFSMLLTAPHLMFSGAVNQGYLDAFLPNALLTFWGLNPASVAGSSFAVTQTKNSITTTMNVMFNAAVGGVTLSLPEGSFTYSTPQFKFAAVVPSSGGSGSSAAAPAAPSAPHGADLAVSASGAGTAVVGDRATYTATVTNNGPSTATGVNLAADLPSELSYVSASSTQGSCHGGVGPATCAIGTLAPGASATMTLIVEATGAGTFSPAFTASSGSSDPNGYNQTQTLQTTVSAPAVAAPPAVTPPATPPATQPPVSVPPTTQPAPQPPAVTPPAVPKPAAKPKAQPKKKQAPAKKKAAPKKKKPAPKKK